MSPKFSDQSKKKIEEILSHYPKKEAALLPVLHLTQREFGCISPTEEKLVAAILEINPIRVREAVTFYSMLNRQPVGKYLYASRSRKVDRSFDKEAGDRAG